MIQGLNFKLFIINKFNICNMETNIGNQLFDAANRI